MSKELRGIIESELKHPTCSLYKESLLDKIRNFQSRKYLAGKILGWRRGMGITMSVDLSRKSKDEVDAFWKALEYFRKAGISFDTGCGCEFDMELDWSLKGAKTICRRCGYDSQKNRELIDTWRKKKHFVTTCDECGKELDSDDGFWHIKPHFWSKTKNYHTNCYNESNTTNGEN
jgi:hypothetical protein